MRPLAGTETIFASTYENDDVPLQLHYHHRDGLLLTLAPDEGVLLLAVGACGAAAVARQRATPSAE